MSPKIKSAKCILVIPARRHSTRLPDKLLLCAGGKTVLQHTYEAACQARLPECILIATDDKDIAAKARRFGAEAVMTSPDCPSGTDRVAEAIQECPKAEIIVNLQGDEPEISPAAIDRLVESLQANPSASVSTLATPIHERELLEDPACVKVVFDRQGRALYFSRSIIPHPREWDDNYLTNSEFHQHIGVYAYRLDFLLKIAHLDPGRTEQIEKLEQLRVLEHGETILVTEIDHATRGIDTAEDYVAFVSRRRAG